MASNFINPGYGKKKNGSLLFVIIAIIAVVGIFICVLVINGSKPKCNAPEIKKDITVELGDEDYKNWNFYFSQIDEKCYTEENVKVDYSKIDPTTVGKYDVDITIGSSAPKIVTVDLVDTKVPLLVVKSEVVLYADVTKENNGISYKPEDFVEKCEDASGVCEVSYDVDSPEDLEKVSSYFEPGSYPIKIIAHDKPTQELPQGRQTIPQTTKLVIMPDKTTCDPKNFVAKDNISIEIGQEVPTDIKEYITEKNDVCWPDEKITLDTKNVNNEVAGEYEVVLNVKNLEPEEIKVKVNVIDNHSPKLTTKALKLTTNSEKENNGISYTAEDFVEKCEVKEGLKCVVQFVTTDIDADEKPIDYGHYINPGEYTVKLLASVFDEGETYKTEVSAKLTIIDGDVALNCEFGTRKYDRTKYHLAYDVSESGCAIDPQSYTSYSIRSKVDEVANLEAQRIKVQVQNKIQNNGKTLYLNICKNPVINETDDGLVGYSIRLVVSRDKVDGINDSGADKNLPTPDANANTPAENGEEEPTGETINDEPKPANTITNVCDAEIASGREIIVDYYLNTDHTRTYSMNPYEIPDDVKQELEKYSQGSQTTPPDDGDSV